MHEKQKEKVKSERQGKKYGKEKQKLKAGGKDS